MDTAKYNSPEYARFKTSPELLASIEFMYSSSILDNDRLGAFGAWEYPSDFERRAMLETVAENFPGCTEVVWDGAKMEVPA